MQSSKMMGFEVPGDRKVPVQVRDWEALKLAAWRSKVAFEIIERQALEILVGCEHAPRCPGKDDETRSCFEGRIVRPTRPLGLFRRLLAFILAFVPRVLLPRPIRLGCPDREKRLSALVILNAARQLAPVDARKPADAPFYAPSREYFSETLATLSACQIENDKMREALKELGWQPPTPVLEEPTQ